MLPSPVVHSSRRFPQPRTPFIGRSIATSDVLSLLMEASRSVVTITGPGGVGKTRLALRIGAIARDHFRDGAIMVPLAPARGEGAVLRAVGQALGLHETRDVLLLDRVVDELGSLDVLLLLDNFEHLLRDAPDVERLVQELPALRLLVTSQAPLNVSGEQVYTLAPLDLPLAPDGKLDCLDDVESVNLFVDRARAVQPDFALTPDNAADVAEICRRLDGLPLAIELAAARIGILPPGALRERLSSSFFETLRRGQDGLPERHRALDATIGWSFELLDAAEQELIQRLAVFAGGFPLSAVETIRDGMEHHDRDGVELLSSLVEKNLVRLLGAVDGEPRYAMLETIRLFSRDRLRAEGHEEDARRRHARWCLTRIAQSPVGLGQVEHSAWVESITAEHENIRAALGWSVANEPELALELSNALWLFWYVQGYLVEGQRWMEQAVGAAIHAPPELKALALNNLGNLQYELGQLDRAERAYTESKALREAARDEVGVADILNNLGMLATARGDTARAHRVLMQSLERAPEIG